MSLSFINIFDSSTLFHYSVAVLWPSTHKMGHVQVCPLPFLAIVGWLILILSCDRGVSTEKAQTMFLLSSRPVLQWDGNYETSEVSPQLPNSMLSTSHSYLWLLWVSQAQLNCKKNLSSGSKVVWILRNQMNTFKLFQKRRRRLKDLYRNCCPM